MSRFRVCPCTWPGPAKAKATEEITARHTGNGHYKSNFTTPPLHIFGGFLQRRLREKKQIQVEGNEFRRALGAERSQPAERLRGQQEISHHLRREETQGHATTLQSYWAPLLPF